MPTRHNERRKEVRRLKIVREKLKKCQKCGKECRVYFLTTQDWRKMTTQALKKLEVACFDCLLEANYDIVPFEWTKNRP